MDGRGEGECGVDSYSCDVSALVCCLTSPPKIVFIFLLALLSRLVDCLQALLSRLVGGGAGGCRFIVV